MVLPWIRASAALLLGEHGAPCRVQLAYFLVLGHLDVDLVGLVGQVLAHLLCRRLRTV